MNHVCGSICCIVAFAFYLTSQIPPGSEEDRFLKSATKIHELKDLEGKVFPLIIAVSGKVSSETNLIKCEHSDILGVILEETVEEEYLKRNWKFSWVEYSVLMEPVNKEVPWYLDDGTGRVNVSGARNATGFVLTFGSDVFEEAEPSSFFQRIFDYLRGFKMLGVRRIDRVLEIGTNLTVVGEAIKDSNGNVKIRKPEQGFFYVTPVPFDQLITDPGEWPWCFKYVSIGLAILGVILISKNGIVYCIDKAIEMTMYIFTRRQRQRQRERERRREREREEREQERLRERLRQESERERLRLERERERLRLERERERLRLETERERLRLERLRLETERERLRQESERERLRLETEREREWERWLQNSRRVAMVDEASKRPEPVSRDLEGQDENSDDLCVICFENKCNALFLPCSHLCCCLRCSSQVIICPLCRAQIDQVLNVFRH